MENAYCSCRLTRVRPRCAATFDRRLVQRMAAAVGTELRAFAGLGTQVRRRRRRDRDTVMLMTPPCFVSLLRHLLKINGGVQQNFDRTLAGGCNTQVGLDCWGPVLNLARDPRWGRN